MITKIRAGLTAHLNTITPLIATAYQGGKFDSTVGVPYQEVYLLPAENENYAISEKSYLSKGVFQITLKYPFGVGTNDIESRCSLYVDSFYFNRKITKDGIDIYIDSTPKIVSLGKDSDRIVYAVTMNYTACVTMV